MNEAWPRVPLGEVLTQSKDVHSVRTDAAYPNFGVYSYGRGLFTKPPILGVATSATTLYRATEGQFVYSRLFAFEGAYAVVGAEQDGHFVSNEFPLFECHSDRLLPAYLKWYFRQRDVWLTIAASSTGMGNRRQRVQPDQLLKCQLLLPPLAEQRRIVTRVEELAAKIAAARGLQHEADDGRAAIPGSVMHAAWGDRRGWKADRIGNLASTVAGQIDPTIEPFASLPHINGESMESGTCRLLRNYRSAKEDGVTSGKYHFRPGAVLYSKIRPYLRKSVHVQFEGVCSADVYAFDEISPELDPKFFAYSLVAPPFTAYANRLSGRTRMPKLNQNQLFAFEMEYPSLPEQQRIVSYLDSLAAKADALKDLQKRTAAELDALLRSILDRAFKGDL
jgi:type I restriction enzyme S subunit